MDKLPRVFASPINKKIDNSQDLYRSDKTNEKNMPSPKEINTKIDKIFASTSHIFKSKVRITLNNGDIDTEIVGKTSTNLLTMDGKLIKIADIIDIEKI